MLQKRTESNQINVGVVVPQTATYPEIGYHFLQGIQLYFTLHPNDFGGKKVELHIEDAGLGREADIGGKVQNLASKNMHAILGWSAGHVIENMAGSAQMAGIPMLWTNLGDSVPRRDLPFGVLYRLEGGHWQSSYHLGQWYGQHESQGVGEILDFLDSGYDFAGAFRLGLPAEKREKSFTQVTNAGGQFNISPSQALDNLAKEGLLPVFSSHPKAWESDVKAYTGKIDRHYRLASPISGTLLKEEISTNPWVLDDTSEEAKRFREGCQEYFEELPDPFYLLGYELGAWLYAGCQHIESVQGWGDMATRIEAFGKVSVPSPRGVLYYHAAQQLLMSPQCITAQREGEALQVLHRLAAHEVVTPDHQDLDPLHTEHKARFINPYMVI